MDVVCAALQLNVRSHQVHRDEPERDSAAPTGREGMSFQLCRHLSATMATTAAVASRGGGNGAATHVAVDLPLLRWQVLRPLLQHGAARETVSRYLIWTDVGALPPLPHASIDVLAAAATIATATSSPTTVDGPTDSTVTRWVDAALWEAYAERQRVSLTTSTTRTTTTTREDGVMAYLQDYTQRCALLRRHALGDTSHSTTTACESSSSSSLPSLCGPVDHVGALPPLLWLDHFFSHRDSRATLLHFLLTSDDENNNKNNISSSDHVAHEASVAWSDSERALDRPLLRATPSACLAWLASSLPNGFEAHLHAHVYFVLSGFYAAPGTPQRAHGDDGGDGGSLVNRGAEPMMHGRFLHLLRAFALRDVTQQPFYALHSASEVASRALKHSGLHVSCAALPPHSGDVEEACGVGGDDENGDNTAALTASCSGGSTATTTGHELLASAVAHCFLAHALDCGADWLAAQSSPASEGRSLATQVLRCLERSHDLCYGRLGADEALPPSNSSPPSSSSSPLLREVHKAMAAALTLLATAGESPVALYLRALFQPLQGLPDAVQEVLSMPSLQTPWGNSPAPSAAPTEPEGDEDKDAGGNKKRSESDALAFLDYDPAPFLVPWTLSETRVLGEEAHVRARQQHMHSHLKDCDPSALQSPFRTTVAATAVLLRHPTAQLALMEQVWRLCTAIASPGSSCDEGLREELGQRLHALYDIYAYSIVEAGVATTGTYEPRAPPPPPMMAAKMENQAEAGGETENAGVDPAQPDGRASKAEDTIADAVATPVPRRRLKLFGAAAAPPPHEPESTTATTAPGTSSPSPLPSRPRRRLTLPKRPREETAQPEEPEQDGGGDQRLKPKHENETKAEQANGDHNGGTERTATNATEDVLLPFDEPTLRWRSPPSMTASTAAAAAAGEDATEGFSLHTALVDTFLAVTRVVQEPLFDVLHASRAQSLNARSPTATATAPTLPRLRLSLGLPACVEHLHRLAASALVVTDAAGGAATAAIGADMRDVLGSVVGSLISYFVYRWTAVVRCGVAPHDATLATEGFARLQRLVGPLLRGWPEAARRYLCYLPISCQLLPRLLSPSLEEKASVAAAAAGSDGTVLPWEAWRRLLEEQNIMEAPLQNEPASTTR